MYHSQISKSEKKFSFVKNNTGKSEQIAEYSSMQEYYSSKEVQEMFKITARTLYNWRKSGKIPFKKVSPKVILYPQDGVLKLLS